MKPGIYKVIQNSPLFLDLYEEEIEEFIKGCNIIEVKKDAFILQEGEHSRELIVLLNGNARVTRGDGTLVNLTKGDLLGELILLNESKQTADVIADTDVDILAIEFNYIYSHFLKNPRVFSILFFNLARMLASRLQTAGNRIFELKAQSS